MYYLQRDTQYDQQFTSQQKIKINARRQWDIVLKVLRRKKKKKSLSGLLYLAKSSIKTEVELTFQINKHYEKKIASRAVIQKILKKFLPFEGKCPQALSKFLMHVYGIQKDGNDDPI